MYLTKVEAFAQICVEVHSVFPTVLLMSFLSDTVTVIFQMSHISLP